MKVLTVSKGVLIALTIIFFVTLVIGGVLLMGNHTDYGEVPQIEILLPEGGEG